MKYEIIKGLNKPIVEKLKKNFCGNYDGEVKVSMSSRVSSIRYDRIILQKNYRIRTGEVIEYKLEDSHNKDNEFKSFRMDNKYYDLLFELYIPDDESKTIELSLIISSDCQYNEYILLTVAIYAVKEVDSDNIYIYLEIIRILNYLYDQRRTKSNFVNIYNGKSLVCKKIEQNNDLFNIINKNSNLLLYSNISNNDALHLIIDDISKKTITDILELDEIDKITVKTALKITDIMKILRENEDDVLD